MKPLHVGRRVVCVDDKFVFVQQEKAVTLPVRGQIYTVRNIEMIDGIPTIRLREIVNPHFVFIKSPSCYTGEVAFKPERFRPLDEDDIDIGVFTSILDKMKVDAPAVITSSR